jgi:hypothetical protein
MNEPGNPMIALSRLKRRPVRWLWPNRLALGALAMFDGDPGLGKSLITLDLCARITTGRPMPGCTEAAEPANVVIIQGEDSTEETVLPRLRALGADLDRVFIFRPDEMEKRELFCLPNRCKLLKASLRIIKPRLVVIDPIMAFLGRKTNAYNEQSVRRALKPLADLARQYECTIILVRHLNKKPGSRALYRGGASIGFNAVCRSAWFFDCDPEDKSRIVMAQNKKNLGGRQESLAYRLVEEAGGDPVVEWLGPCAWDSDQLAGAGGRRAAQPRDHDTAEKFVVDFLENGARSTEEIWEAAREEGIARRTLQRARRYLNIKSRRVWNGHRQLTYWLLDGQKLPDSIPPEHRPDDIDDLFAEERAKYPLDPLDDDD